jgi:hypothetical protein
MKIEDQQGWHRPSIGFIRLVAVQSGIGKYDNSKSYRNCGTVTSSEQQEASAGFS